jgi:hypothetical protein
MSTNHLHGSTHLVSTYYFTFLPTNNLLVITYVLPIYMHVLNYESLIILPTYLPTGPRSPITYHIGYQGET